MVGDPREDVGKIRLRVEPLSFAVSISEYIAEARGPPASEPIKRQFWWPMAKGALGCIVVEAQAADLEAAKQRVNAVHRARIYRKAAASSDLRESRRAVSSAHAATRARCFASGPETP